MAFSGVDFTPKLDPRFEVVGRVIVPKENARRAREAKARIDSETATEVADVLGGIAASMAASAVRAASGAGGHSSSGSASSSSASSSSSDAAAASSSSFAGPEYVPSSLPLEERFELARSVGEECIQESELRTLLEKKPFPVCYDGFEPSGRIHIAQGILKAINVNKLTAAGCVFKFWVADWFALMNNKMGGDIKKIRKVGEYMVEVWKAAGMDMSNVEFLWASDEINKRSDEYWSTVLDIARRNTVSRILRCCTIMGRSEKDELSAAQIMYPCMQCADIFFLKADVCQLGMDQRKVNMLAREHCSATKRKFKPVILSHHMLMGLKEGQEKMSKSDPNSAVFMEDDAGTVRSKIKKAFCPAGVADGNPVLDWTKHIVFAKHDTWTVHRSDANGGDIEYTAYEELEKDFLSGALHPGDLKANLADAINKMLDPVREHFKTDKRAKALLKQVRAFKVTR